MKCVPLELLNKMSNKYPKCWEHVEMFRDAKKNGEFSWNDRCYIPITGCLAISSNGGEGTLEATVDGTTIAALAPWRLYKQIFTFDEELETLLIEQADNIVIPMDVLYSLPYDCVYIELSDGNTMNGFFVHFESDVKTGRMELRFLVVHDDLKTLPFIVYLNPGNTIEDGIKQSIEEAQKYDKTLKSMPAKERKILIDKSNEMQLKVVGIMIQFVLYICAANRDVKEDAEQAKITRIPKSPQFIKDKYREIRKWKCGEQVGNVIRSTYGKTAQKYNWRSENQGTGSTKRPHARRGHWHHFWRGAKNSEERRLELRWVAPTFVHKDALNEELIKINEVKATS